MIASLLVLSAMQAAPAQTPPPEWAQGDWVFLTDEDGARIDYDQSGLRLEGDKLRIRIRTHEPETPRGVRWGTSDWELDCRAWTYRRLAISEYLPNGTLVWNSAEPEPAPSSPRSGAGRTNIEMVCRRAGWREAGAAE